MTTFDLDPHAKLMLARHLKEAIRRYERQIKYDAHNDAAIEAHDDAMRMLAKLEKQG